MVAKRCRPRRRGDRCGHTCCGADRHRGPGAAVRGAVVDAGGGRRAWPAPVVVAGTVVFAGALVAFPRADVPRATAAGSWTGRPATGDTMLGVIWVLFVWALLGNVVRLALLVGRASPTRPGPGSWRPRCCGVAVVLVLWGYVEAMRVPRVRRVDVTIPRLGAGLDGVRVVLLTDTHYGPIDRARWSARRDRGGQRARRRHRLPHRRHRRRHGRPAPGAGRAARRRPGPAGPGLRDRQPRVLRRGRRAGSTTCATSAGSRCTTGTSWSSAAAPASSSPASTTRTAASSGRAGHRADHAAALAGADPDLPVLLLAHQPKQIDDAVAARRRPAALRAHPRRPDLAVPLPGPARPAGRAGPEPARRRGPSSTPAAAPASGARRSGSSRRARSPCSRCVRVQCRPEPFHDSAALRSPAIRPIWAPCNTPPMRPPTVTRSSTGRGRSAWASGSRSP